jgi:ribosomal-protein-alanine N-acetyltransferase
MIGTVELPAGVRLRPLATGDAKALLAAYERNRDHLAPWEPFRPPSWYSVEGQQTRLDRLLAEYEKGEALPCALVRDGMIVGNATLRAIMYGPVCGAEMGYWIDSAFTRQGLATATVAALCRIADEELGLHRLAAGTAPENKASQGVLTRNGFQQWGYAHSHLFVAGRWGDAVMFEKILNDRPPAT